MTTKLFDYPKIENIITVFEKLSDEDWRHLRALFLWLYEQGAIYLPLSYRLATSAQGWGHTLAYRRAKGHKAKALKEFQEAHGRLPEKEDEHWQVTQRALEMIDELP